MKIGDKVQFVSKTSRGTSTEPQVYEVEDIIPPIEGVSGLHIVAYIKVRGRHGYWVESQFVLRGDDGTV